jgi:hypothetical protein
VLGCQLGGRNVVRFFMQCLMLCMEGGRQSQAEEVGGDTRFEVRCDFGRVCCEVNW